MTLQGASGHILLVDLDNILLLLSYKPKINIT